MDDLFYAQILSIILNLHRTGNPIEPRELMVFPPEVTEEDVQKNREAAAAKLTSYLGIVKANKGKTKPKASKKAK